MTNNGLINYDAAYAAAMEDYAKQQRAGGATSISLQGGIMRVGDAQMPGNQMAVVILDYVLENTYFDAKFDPNTVMPPKCYAFGREESAMFPHIESMQKDMNYFMPQHFENGAPAGCTGCPKNEWGSADTGRGKACGNRYKLALLPAGFYTTRDGRNWELSLNDSPSHYAGADVAYLKLPVTSGKNFDDYLRQLGTLHRRPPFGALTRIFTTPDAKAQFKVNFELIELLSAELAPTVIQRNMDERARPFEGYQAPEAQPLARNMNIRR